jgi:hypothetical protein
MSIGIVVAVIAYRVVECCDRARGARVSRARTTSPASSDGDTDHEDVMVVAEGLHHRGDPYGEGCRRRIMSPGKAAALDTLIREGGIPQSGGPSRRHRRESHSDPRLLAQQRWLHLLARLLAQQLAQQRWLHLLAHLHRIRRLQRIWHHLGEHLRLDVSPSVRRDLSQLKMG